MCVTDMELEGCGGARRRVLPVQLHFFGLGVLWFQGTVTQEADTVRKAQLPALGVGLKVHHQSWARAKRDRRRERERGEGERGKGQ